MKTYIKTAMVSILAFAVVGLSGGRALAQGPKAAPNQPVANIEMANLEGEIYIKDASGETFDFGNYRLSDQVDKSITEHRLMKMGYFLSNEGIVEDGNSILALVNQTTLSNPDRTSYLYFTHVGGVDFGVFEVKKVSTQAITLVVEDASGKRSTAELRKKSGTFLPY